MEHRSYGAWTSHRRGWLPGVGALLTVAAVACPTSDAGAQTVVAPGSTVENVTAATDTTQSYALYLPSSYDPHRTWPILFLMDPRGRALVPLSRFREAAERDGFILISSYNTLSDGPVAPNVTALNAMLGDAGATFALDTRRFYLVGFSGTARLAWDFATQLNGHVAGIFGASAGTGTPLPWEMRDAERPTVAFYGTAGRIDFNYEEMIGFRSSVRGWGLPERFRVFDGPHAWPPEEICADALDWFTLQAMRSDLIPLRQPFVDSLYDADLRQAEALEGDGSLLDAYHRYQEMLSDYDGLHPLDPVRERSSALGGSRLLREQLDEQNRLVKEAVTYDGELAAVLVRVRDAEAPPDTAEIMRRLRIVDLQAKATAGDARGYAARRLLARAFVHTSFYGPRAELREGHPARAVSLLRVASAIEPGNPNVRLNLARALSRAGQPDEALAELGKAIEGGVSPVGLSQDSAFASVRADPRFKELVGGSRRPSGGSG